MAVREEAVPAHTRQRPQWVSHLLELASADFPKAITGVAESLVTKLSASPEVHTRAPLWVMDFAAFSVPGVYPMKGAVEKLKEHHFMSDARFPPRACPWSSPSTAP